MNVKVDNSEGAFNYLLHKYLSPHIQAVQGPQKSFSARNAYFFYVNSYQDYLAARVLLNNNLLLQGCVMANTFVEKILKVHILFEDSTFKKKIHKSADLFDYLAGLQPFVKSLIHRPFVEFLAKTYNTRYYESLERDYNLYISYRRVLAELDYTAFVLLNSLEFVLSPNKAPANTFKQDFLHVEKRLFDQNHLLDNMEKTFFIEGFPDKTHEFRIFSKLGDTHIDAYRENVQAHDDRIFNRPGLVCDIEEKAGRFRITKHYNDDKPHKSSPATELE